GASSSDQTRPHRHRVGGGSTKATGRCGPCRAPRTALWRMPGKPRIGVEVGCAWFPATKYCLLATTSDGDVRCQFSITGGIKSRPIGGVPEAGSEQAEWTKKNLRLSRVPVILNRVFRVMAGLVPAIHVF